MDRYVQLSLSNSSLVQDPGTTKAVLCEETHNIASQVKLLHQLWKPLNTVLKALSALAVRGSKGLEHPRADAGQEFAQRLCKWCVAGIVADEDQRSRRFWMPIGAASVSSLLSSEASCPVYPMLQDRASDAAFGQGDLW
jgi:hypothetical protein